jgi:hypothetical protein
MSSAFRKLLQSCWRPEERKRPSMETVLRKLQQLKKEGPPKITLSLDNAQRYRKKQTVFAYRSKDPVTILKDWGKSRGGPGAYVILGSNDDVYTCVVRVLL